MVSFNPQAFTATMAEYRGRFNQDLGGVTRTATMLGKLEQLSADLRTALTENRPIPDLAAYAANMSSASKAEPVESSTATA